MTELCERRTWGCEMRSVLGRPVNGSEMPLNGEGARMPWPDACEPRLSQIFWRSFWLPCSGCRRSSPERSPLRAADSQRAHRRIRRRCDGCVEGLLRARREVSDVSYLLVARRLKHGTVISIYPASREDLQGMQSPLLLNVRREGVAISRRSKPLWPGHLDTWRVRPYWCVRVTSSPVFRGRSTTQLSTRLRPR